MSIEEKCKNFRDNNFKLYFIEFVKDFNQLKSLPHDYMTVESDYNVIKEYIKLQFAS